MNTSAFTPKEIRIKADQCERHAQMFEVRAERFFNEGKFDLCAKAVASKDAAYSAMNYFVRLYNAALESERNKKFGVTS